MNIQNTKIFFKIKFRKYRNLLSGIGHYWIINNIFSKCVNYHKSVLFMLFKFGHAVCMLLVDLCRMRSNIFNGISNRLSAPTVHLPQEILFWPPHILLFSCVMMVRVSSAATWRHFLMSLNLICLIRINCWSSDRIWKHQASSVLGVACILRLGRQSRLNITVIPVMILL